MTMKIRFLFLLASISLLGSTILLLLPEDSFAMPPLERVNLLSDTKILDRHGNELGSIPAGQQILIATPSFTAQSPYSINYGCGKTIVDGDELRCVEFASSQQNVEGDKLVGESRFNQHVVSITQVKDPNGVTVHLSWIDGILEGDHVLSTTVSWIPEEPGSYSITTFFWESIDNPTALAPPSSIEVTVT